MKANGNTAERDSSHTRQRPSSCVICPSYIDCIAGRKWQTFVLKVQPSGSNVRVFFQPVFLILTKVYFCGVESAEVMKHLNHLVWAVACMWFCPSLKMNLSVAES